MFRKYFETIYRIDDLSRTIWEAAHTLKEKILKKLPDLETPSYVKYEDMYEFALKFYTSRFPCLPSADVALALRPPFPDWFFCGSHLKLLK